MNYNCDHEYIPDGQGNRWCWKCDDFETPEDQQSRDQESKADAAREEKYELQKPINYE